MATLTPTGSSPAAQQLSPGAGAPQTGAGSPQTGASNNSSQSRPIGNPGSTQGKLPWWKRTAQWNWAERAQWLAVITLITGIVYGAVSWISSNEQGAIAKWEAEKDFFLYCQSIKGSVAKMPVDCNSIVDRGLPPPPSHSPNFFYALSALLRRTIGGVWSGNQTLPGSPHAKFEATSTIIASSLLLSSKSCLVQALKPSYTDSCPQQTNIGITTDSRSSGVQFIGIVPALIRICIPFPILQYYVDLGRTTKILQDRTISILSANLWLRVRGAHAIRMWFGLLIRYLRPVFQAEDVDMPEEGFAKAQNMQTQWRFSTHQVVEATAMLIKLSKTLGDIIIFICFGFTLILYIALPLYPLAWSLYRLTLPENMFSIDVLYELMYVDFGISQVGMFVPRLESFLASVFVAAETSEVPGMLSHPSELSAEIGKGPFLDPGVFLFVYGFVANFFPISLPMCCRLLGVQYGLGVGLAAYVTGTCLIGVIMKNTCVLMKLYRIRE